MRDAWICRGSELAHNEPTIVRWHWPRPLVFFFFCPYFLFCAGPAALAISEPFWLLNVLARELAQILLARRRLFLFFFLSSDGDSVRLVGPARCATPWA